MEKISVLIPHYKTLKMTAYTVSQFLKFSEGHSDIEIVVIDNSFPDSSIRGLAPFVNKIKIIPNISDKISSHGIAYDMAIEKLDSDWFLTVESDAYPTRSFYEYYKKIIDDGYDAAVTPLKLSGGLYGHPCGSLYSRKVYDECKNYLSTVPYFYFPNMNKRQGFDYHMMIHNQWLDKVLKNPDDFFDLSSSYLPYSKELALKRMEHYKPCCGVFHNGMGNLNEEVLNYGTRGFDTGVIDVIFDEKSKITRRVGYEPGQYFSYWLLSMNKKVFNIPIEVKWMQGRENQQQEFTVNEAGIKHIWGVSSYTERPAEGVEDIFKEKRELPEKLYDTLPQYQKVV